jgi:SAM-dependent methyltransferase
VTPIRTAYRKLRRMVSDARRKREFTHVKQTLLASEDLLDAEKRLLREVSLEVHPDDRMYWPGIAEGYLTAGLSATQCIQSSLEAAGKTITSGAILDFPCGYGRVLRYLRIVFPACDIVGAEIEPSALAFCKRVFSIRGFASQGSFRDLSFPTAFDLIWCGSLVTHLNERSTTDLLQFFYRQLADGGVCIFTTHGTRVAEMMQRKETTWFSLTEEGRRRALEGYERSGYGYSDYPDPSRGGISLTSHAKILEIARRAGPWQLVSFQPKGWHGLQDVYAFAKPAAGSAAP